MSYKNYGLKISTTPDPKAYKIGGVSLPKIVLQPDGDWSNYLPVYEPQFGGDWDTYGCVIWGNQNAIEIILKKITGIEYNFSERFNYIIGNVQPPGSDPHEQLEYMRKYGVIDQIILSMTKTYEEFITPKPMTPTLLDKGKNWGYELQHQYVWNGNQTLDQQKVLIKEYLQYSPLGVTVTAWFQENGVYVDRGESNTHWCVLYGIAENGYKVFDSYDQSQKILSFNHHISVCKRYSLAKKKPQWWLPRLVNRLLN